MSVQKDQKTERVKERESKVKGRILFK